MHNFGVFLADDHALIREGLKALVNAQPDMTVVGEADNGRSAWQKVRELQPDVAVMDISMPEGNGIQSTEMIKQHCPHVKVLILTVHEDRGYLRQALKAGASGYALKRAVSEELIRAIRVVLAGGVYLDPALAGKVFGKHLSRRFSKDGSPRSELSDRETEVLRLVALGHSNKEIATKLEISVKTVETYKARLMEKLDLRSRVDMVRYALDEGWLQQE